MNNLIEELYTEIDFEMFSDCEHAVHGVTSCPKCCSGQYFNDNEINYSCEQKMKLYIIRYLPVHASEVRSSIGVLKNNAVMNRILSQDNLNVLSIGGGPGSDIIGFREAHRSIHELREFLEEESYVAEINYLKVEINDDWNALFERVINISVDGRLGHVNENYECIYGDATSIVLGIDTQDVILLSYIVSELTDDEAIMLANNIKRWSDENTIIIVNDRNQEEVTNRVNLMFEILNAQDAGEFESTGWAGFFYPDEIRDSCEVKLNRSSMVSYAVGCQ
ncbi:hypothetical protein K8D10_14725 [Aeromonas veronii]|uniref:hypothetical protein n=1 Tax=Aeromonas veronii TaxID=654 RepID=UPI00207CCCCF|nr:hypothetical protein [Aeromonas veronii]MCO4173013.1 hypothetical protein [Aeromonas veronii]